MSITKQRCWLRDTPVKSYRIKHKSISGPWYDWTEKVYCTLKQYKLYCQGKAFFYHRKESQ